MRTLLDHIEEFSWESEAESVSSVFNAMGLPIPQEHEFTFGNDGTLVFLNPVGCVLRIQFNNADKLTEHPHILQPLGRRKRGDMVFDINPGITCPASGRQMRRVKGILADDGFDFWDAMPMNCGYLPAVTGLIKKKEFPVVLDPGAVSKLHTTIEELNALYPGMNLKDRDITPRTDMQKILYAPLREAFDKAWPANDDLPDPDKMNQFWKMCAAFKEEGKLVTSWLGWKWKFAALGLGSYSDKSYKNVAGGEAYAQRWGGPQ